MLLDDLASDFFLNIGVLINSLVTDTAGANRPTTFSFSSAAALVVEYHNTTKSNSDIIWYVSTIQY